MFTGFVFDRCYLFLCLQNLLACFHSGSDSFSGDACEVKVAAPSHSPSAEAEYWRIKAMAQQVSAAPRLSKCAKLMQQKWAWCTKKYQYAKSLSVVV